MVTIRKYIKNKTQLKRENLLLNVKYHVVRCRDDDVFHCINASHYVQGRKNKALSREIMVTLDITKS